jgi:hypothetical protein
MKRITLSVVLAWVFMAGVEDAFLRHVRDHLCAPISDGRYGFHVTSCALLRNDDGVKGWQLYGYYEGVPFRYRRLP